MASALAEPRWRWTLTNAGLHLMPEEQSQCGDLVITACGRITHVLSRQRSLAEACEECAVARQMRTR